MINVKDNTYTKKNKIAITLAWIGLVIMILLIAFIAYALIMKNGMLALAMIVALAFVSIVYWIGIIAYKSMVKRDEMLHEKETRKSMVDLANMSTKNMTKGS